MCDYSLTHIKSRPASVGDKLTTRAFGTGTTGFASPDDPDMAVCVLPGTELAFEDDLVFGGVWWDDGGASYSTGKSVPHRTARFRQINRERERMHHDALELPDGQVTLLTHLTIGQKATVLQLPATPKTEAEAEAQRRVEFVR